MYYFIALFTFVLTASADMDFEKCIKILNSTNNCCTIPLHKSSVINDIMKECDLMPRDPGTCDKALCFGTKVGFATEDGTINMDKLQKYMEENNSDHLDILTAIKEDCLDGGYKSFGETDECDLNKIMQCVRWQYVFRCPNISKEESCKDFKDIGAKCLELNF